MYCSIFRWSSRIGDGGDWRERRMESTFLLPVENRRCELNARRHRQKVGVLSSFRKNTSCWRTIRTRCWTDLIRTNSSPVACKNRFISSTRWEGVFFARAVDGLSYDAMWKQVDALPTICERWEKGIVCFSKGVLAVGERGRVGKCAMRLLFGSRSVLDGVLFNANEGRLVVQITDPGGTNSYRFAHLSSHQGFHRANDSSVSKACTQDQGDESSRHELSLHICESENR